MRRAGATPSTQHNRTSHRETAKQRSNFISKKSKIKTNIQIKTYVFILKTISNCVIILRRKEHPTGYKKIMDFRYKNYYLIEKAEHDQYGNGSIASKIKRYFKCKLKCHQYVYDDDKYTYCVSINKEDASRLIIYLKDNNIKYQQVTTEPKRETYFRFSWTSKERLEEIERLKKETSKIKQMYNNVKIINAKLASTITDISDLDVNRIFVSGTNKSGSKENIEIEDKIIIQMIVNILMNKLETIWEELK